MLKIIFVFTLPLSHDALAELVEVIKINKNIRLDVRYATINNFTGKIIYPSAKCYLQKEAAKALSKVQKDLEKTGLCLKVFDGYRPLSVQKIFWDLLKNRYPNPFKRCLYVANPTLGSKHNRGGAVDVTLVDLRTGKELKMPSEFDDFSEKAHKNYGNMTKSTKKNCKLLEAVMIKHGFTGNSKEWWHFNFNGWEQYPILDISFDALASKSS